jgi:hypothetical protein
MSGFSPCVDMANKAAWHSILNLVLLSAKNRELITGIFSDQCDRMINGRILGFSDFSCEFGWQNC